MSAFPGSPIVQKGAIIGLDPMNPAASIIVFQYNPEKMTRSVTPQTSGGNADKGEAMRLKGPPKETIKIEVVIDASDQLEKGNVPIGIYPQLSMLELLLYPKSSSIIANEVLIRMGVIEVIQPELPLALFVWGIKRVLPVRLTSMTINEEAFDTKLNPIRASVNIDLTVLNYSDLELSSRGGALFMSHQIVKETMATMGSLGNLTVLPKPKGVF